MSKRVKVLTADQVISEIAEVLSQASGEFIEEIANKVLTVPVKYQEDSLFEREEETNDNDD